MNCECAQNGFCKRYNMDVIDRQRFLCKTSEAHRKLFSKMSEVNSKKDDYPPLFWRIASFVLSMLHWLLIGFDRVDKEAFDRRISFCRGSHIRPPCPQYEDGWCRSCGCAVSVKSLIPSSFCPKLKWPAIEHKSSRLPFIQMLQQKTRLRGCGCSSKSPPPSLPIIQGDP